MPETESLVIQLLRGLQEDVRGVRGEVSEMRASMARKSDLSGMASKEDLAELRADLHSEMHSLRADVASDLLHLEKRLNEQNVALRRAVMEYHSTAVGHGLLYSDLNERVRRIEQRLEMTAPAPD